MTHSAVRDTTRPSDLFYCVQVVVHSLLIGVILTSGKGVEAPNPRLTATIAARSGNLRPLPSMGGHQSWLPVVTHVATHLVILGRRCKLDNPSMARSHVDNLLIRLGKDLGMDRLGLDKADHCILKIEDGPNLHMEYFEDEDLLVIVAALEPVPKDKQLAAYTALLKGNFMWQGTFGATLAVQPESDAIVVQHKLVAAAIEPVTFQGIIDGFDGLCRHWRDRIAALDEPATKEQPAAHHDSSHGFIRI